MICTLHFKLHLNADDKTHAILAMVDHTEDVWKFFVAPRIDFDKYTGQSHPSLHWFYLDESD